MGRTETEEGKLSGAAEEGLGRSQMPDTREPCLLDPNRADWCAPGGRGAAVGQGA